MEYAKGSHVAIHEYFVPVKQLMEKWDFALERTVSASPKKQIIISKVVAFISMLHIFSWPNITTLALVRPGRM